jgi:hypothetical protein
MRRIGIIALDYRTAVDIAEAMGLTRDSRAWYYVQTGQDLMGRRHQPQEGLFDPEYDVLVEESIGHKRADWPELQTRMDSAGLVYVKAPSTIPPF